MHGPALPQRRQVLRFGLILEVCRPFDTSFAACVGLFLAHTAQSRHAGNDVQGIDRNRQRLRCECVGGLTKSREDVARAAYGSRFFP